ncbi:hypothetical protein OAH18_00660 [bacterium]|nr:hypothetical protein [bacterium]
MKNPAHQFLEAFAEFNKYLQSVKEELENAISEKSPLSQGELIWKLHNLATFLRWPPSLEALLAKLKPNLEAELTADPEELQAMTESLAELDKSLVFIPNPEDFLR